MRRSIWLSAPATTVVATLLTFTIVGQTHAGAGTCRVHNERTGEGSAGSGANLQEAIDDAERGDTLAVRGRCVGTFSLPVRLELRGPPASAGVSATLDAADQGHVIATDEGGRLTNLLVEGGMAQRGGGIFMTGGRLVLAGSTTVRRNVAESGGGAYLGDGRLLLTGRSSIRGNVADNGGGVFATTVDAGAYLTAGGTSRIRGNRARSDGGGIYGSIAVIRITGRASVRGNAAERFGGGIADYDGSSEFRAHASVVYNRAGRRGGGLIGFFANGRVCSAHVRLSPNDPDDAPDLVVQDC
jgi:hypothetical protein